MLFYFIINIKIKVCNSHKLPVRYPYLFVETPQFIILRSACYYTLEEEYFLYVSRCIGSTKYEIYFHKRPVLKSMLIKCLYYFSPSQSTAASDSLFAGSGPLGNKIQHGTSRFSAAGEGNRDGRTRLRTGLCLIEYGLAVQRYYAGARGRQVSKIIG